jgi:hypothetical protein
MLRRSIFNVLIATSVIAVSLLADGGTRSIPSAMAATTTTVNFGSIPVGTAVSNQLDAQGLDFENGIIGLGVYCYPVVKQIYLTLKIKESVGDISCADGEFGDSSAWGVLKNDADTVSIQAGFFPSSDPPSTTTVTLTGYDADGTPITSDTEAVNVAPFEGANTALSVTSATPNIAQFSVSNSGNQTPGCDCPGVVLGSVTFDNPNGVPPDFRIRPESSEMAVARGISNTDIVDINRLNGSSDGITFSATGLPAGVTASFSPNPATGDTTTMTLSAIPTMGVTTQFPYPNITVVATPDSAAAGPGPQAEAVGLDIFPPYTIQVPPLVDVPPCSTIQVPVKVTWSLDPITFKQPFNGQITLSQSGVPSDDQASFNPTTVTPDSGTNSTTSMLTLTSQSDTSSPSSDVLVTGTSGSESEQSSYMTVSRVAPSITAVVPAGGHTPQGGQSGSQVTVDGQGFCPGTQLAFGNSKALVVSPVENAAHTTLTAAIPPLATTGNVYAIAPGKSLSSTGTLVSPQPYIIDNYRDINGFSFDNSNAFQNAVGGYSFSDVSDVFGYDQTHVGINPCYPFGDCSITTPVPDPFALLFWGVADVAIEDGQCFGFSLASQRLMHGDEFYSTFPSQPGASTESVWNLQGPDSAGGPTSSIAHYIHLMHMEQLSSEALNWYVGNATAGALDGSQGSIIGEVNAALENGDHPLILLRESGTEGHAVVAYATEDGTGGDRIIDVYDPNQEFKTSENTDTTGQSHALVLASSEIVVHSDGHWEFQGAFPDSPWHAGPGSLVVMPYGTVPVQPTMPFSLDGLIDFVFGAAHTTQLTNAAGHTMFTSTGAVNTDPKTDIPDATQFAVLSGERTPSQPDIVIMKSTDVASSRILNTTKGQYHNVFFGDHMAASITATSDPGMTDNVSVVPGLEGLKFGQTSTLKKGEGTRPVSVQLLVHATDGSERTATIGTDMPNQAQEALSFNASENSVTVTAPSPPPGVPIPYPNQGYSLSLSWTGPNGYPQTFEAPPVKLSLGATASLTPSNWSDLQSAAATLTVTQKNGTQITTVVKNKARPANSFRVRLTVAKAKTGRRLVVAAGFKKVVKGSTATFTWQILKAGALVSSHASVMATSKLHKGNFKPSFGFVGVTGARYNFRGTVSVISPSVGGGVLTQTITNRRAFKD